MIILISHCYKQEEIIGTKLCLVVGTYHDTCNKSQKAEDKSWYFHSLMLPLKAGQDYPWLVKLMTTFSLIKNKSLDRISVPVM